VAERSTFDTLIAQLRKTLNVVEDVMVLREPLSSQILFVNRSILLDGLMTGRPTNTLFVTASDDPNLICCPQGVRDVLGFLGEHLENARASGAVGIDLPPMLTSDAIALAGYLLEYPVSYAPSIEMDNHLGLFLSNVTLTIVSTVLVSSNSREPFTVIQFSYPSSLVNVVEDLTDDRIMYDCRALFTTRLDYVSVSWLPGAHIETSICTKTLDRLAL